MVGWEIKLPSVRRYEKSLFRIDLTQDVRSYDKLELGNNTDIEVLYASMTSPTHPQYQRGVIFRRKLEGTAMGIRPENRAVYLREMALCEAYVSVLKKFSTPEQFCAVYVDMMGGSEGKDVLHVYIPMTERGEGGTLTGYRVRPLKRDRTALAIVEALMTADQETGQAIPQQKKRYGRHRSVNYTHARDYAIRALMAESENAS